MDKIMIRKIYGLIALGAFLWLLPSVGLGQCNVSIGTTSYPSINDALNAAGPSTIINVSGTCNDIVTISANKNNIALNGGKTAIITCQDPVPANVCATQGNIMIFGKQILITGFEIKGGLDGIEVLQGGSARIEANNIHDTERFGIAVAQDSFATILSNTINNNGVNPDLPVRAGIAVSDNSSAYVGILTLADTVAQGNTIQNNPTGVFVSHSSTARIIGNVISNNTDDGIMVMRASQADISDNTIDDNGQNGIFVSQGSGVNLGNDTGNTIFDIPNSGTNGAKGLSCSIGGYVDGVVGTLRGIHGRYGFSKGCFNSVKLK